MHTTKVLPMNGLSTSELSCRLATLTTPSRGSLKAYRQASRDRRTGCQDTALNSRKHKQRETSPADEAHPTEHWSVVTLWRVANDVQALLHSSCFTRLLLASQLTIQFSAVLRPQPPLPLRQTA